tara:strand:- start:7056 stop:7958 length:903 start_codon:yes stop_codon:yes gene_type:complete
MSVHQSLLRYIHILNKLRKAPASFLEIDNYLTQQSELQGERFNISKRQFRRSLDDIESIFELDIVYDGSRDVYFINENSLSELSQRRLEAFDTFNALKIGQSTSRNIHFEKRRPQGTEHLWNILHAINNGLQISFEHQKFWDRVSTIRIVEPYALKEVKNRWYVVAKEQDGELVKTFGLDRITNLKVLKDKFQLPDDFDVDTVFDHCFGIISPGDGKIEEIILSFKPHQGKYIKSLPLHESQEILIDNENELRVKLELYITYDLVLEILSHGDAVKVIGPKKLADQIKEVYQKALTQYED